jgi:hypothetical protein
MLGQTERQILAPLRFVPSKTVFQFTVRRGLDLANRGRDYARALRSGSISIRIPQPF